MNIVGELVQHNKLGFGRVVSQTKSTVLVEFYNGHQQKEFPYPSTFRNEMQLSDPLARHDFEFELSHPSKQPTSHYFDF
jgi:hypothetical protein